MPEAAYTLRVASGSTQVTRKGCSSAKGMNLGLFFGRSLTLLPDYFFGFTLHRVDAPRAIVRKETSRLTQLGIGLTHFWQRFRQIELCDSAKHRVNNNYVPN